MTWFKHKASRKELLEQIEALVERIDNLENDVSTAEAVLRSQEGWRTEGGAVMGKRFRYTRGDRETGIVEFDQGAPGVLVWIPDGGPDLCPPGEPVAEMNPSKNSRSFRHPHV